MTKKIFRSIFITSLSVLIASLVLVSAFLYHLFMSVRQEQLDEQLTMAMQGVSAMGESYFEGLQAKNTRLTWIASDGSVIADTKAAPATMENHMDRKEIKDAFQTGVGREKRYSETLMKQTIYLARKMPDGTVLRCSVTGDSVIPMMMGMMYPTALVIIMAAVLAAVMASRMSGKIVSPINGLDLDHPLENEVYEELAPFLTHMEQQNRKIKSQFKELRKNQTEFEAVTENMNEGLVVLGAAGKILSINNAAKKLFNADGDYTGKDIVTLCRDAKVKNAIDGAQESGRSGIVIERDGRTYQLDVSRIEGPGNEGGTVIIAFDITERLFAERNRREFTANVSHELKTPVQSIMGSAELIENGLVKKEDLPRFIGNIRREAGRLVQLIDDIIRLSQLDEKHDIPFERVDLYAEALEVREELAQTAQKRDVKISVSGDSTVIDGVQRFVHEIIYNLCENAVKYNKESGRVDIFVLSENGKAEIKVKDTGIGIPREHLARIFERFYRVDKSRSKETGGTGLGLSIVKHAAEFLGAKIFVESEEQIGTTVTVTFDLLKMQKL